MGGEGFKTMLEGKRIVVTGGCGFIGSHLVEVLWKENGVIVIDDLSSGDLKNIEGFAVEFHHRSITEPLDDLFSDVDIVFHTAASVSVVTSVDDPRHDARVNIGGLLNVLETARRSGVGRSIFSSSTAVYGRARFTPITEEHPTEPLSPYGLSKLTGEGYFRLYHSLYGLETVCLRYFNVYGPRQQAHSPYSGVISIFSRNFLEGKPSTIYGNGLQTRDFVYVKDVVRANLLAATGGKEIVGRVFNIGTGLAISIKDLASLLGVPAEATVYGPPRPGDIRESVSDPGLSKNVLGFQATVTLEEGLDRYLGWYGAELERTGEG